MEIIITIKDKKVSIILLERKVEKDALKIVEEHSLSQKLLPSIDKLLKRNNLTAKDIKKMRVASDQDNTFTTTRIAKTVAEAWNFSHIK